MLSTDKVFASPSSMRDIFHVFRIEACVDHLFALCSLFGEKNMQPLQDVKRFLTQWQKNF